MGYFIHDAGRENGRRARVIVGFIDRAHLVIDAVVNDGVAALFERAAGAASGRAA